MIQTKNKIIHVLFVHFKISSIIELVHFYLLIKLYYDYKF